ncbi:MAG: AI-2E family transporter [Burkholderiaceae bacterium]|jgi:predicted PurR-regulated permease PerM|nr:AI-2E family transporter [Burkholderiaceae bacterium]
MNSPRLQRSVFLTLLALVSMAFVVILLPFAGAILWSLALAILFTPLYKRLLRPMRRHPTAAALLTLAISLFIVILPLTLVVASLTQEVVLLAQSIRSGRLDFATHLQQIVGALPQWARHLMDRLDIGSAAALQTRVTALAMQGSQRIATHALSIGQHTFDFLVHFCVMLYLLFFLLRDGARLTARIRKAIPLSDAHTDALLGKFATAIRATVKGNIAVAAVQGAIGGLAFWFLGVQASLLWAVLMAFLSLLPAVGAALVWLPVAIYFLATGAIWQGLFLIFVGVVVIGLIDNALRPLLVGKDTQMPDYVVLMSTLGGMALLGFNGFVIGPVVAALFMACWDLFAANRQPPSSQPPTAARALRERVDKQ